MSSIQIEALMDWQIWAAQEGDVSLVQGTDMDYDHLSKTTLWEYTKDISEELLIPIDPKGVTAETVDDFGNPITVTYKRKDEYKKDMIEWEKYHLERYVWTHRGPRHSRLIQLAFHDCLRYSDGTGGCDGCINWSEMGMAPPDLIKDGFKEEDDEADEDEETCKIKILNVTKTNLSF